MDNPQNPQPQDELALMADYFSNVERQGPGSDACTRLALDLVRLQTTTELTAIADLGCGTGAATLRLARENADAHVTAVDLLPAFIAKLRAKATAEGLDHRLSALVGDMAEPPFSPADAPFDLIWSEGAIYNIGFERGLKAWRRYLKTGGFVAVTELSWLSERRPAEIERFWQTAYPGIDTVPHKMAQMQDCGYRLCATFRLPEDCWTTHYYEPQRQAQSDFLNRHPGDAAARTLVEGLRQEAALYDRFKAYYGYVFYIGQKA